MLRDGALATLLLGPPGFTHSLCSNECGMWSGGNGNKFFAKGDLRNPLFPFEWPFILSSSMFGDCSCCLEKL